MERKQLEGIRESCLTTDVTLYLSHCYKCLLRNAFFEIQKPENL